MATTEQCHSRIRWMWLVGVVGFVGALVAVAPVAALTFTVNNTADVGDFACDGVCNVLDAGPPVCTLRAAIEEANCTGSSDTIRFKKTLKLINVFDSIDIEESVRIIGDCTRPQVINGAASNDGIFNINDGNSVLKCLRFEDGNEEDGSGGCLDIGNASDFVQIIKVTFDSCRAESGGANGGAVINRGDAVTIQNSKFINNHADNDGGGLYTGAEDNFFAFTMVTKYTLFQGNQADDDGGGMANQENNATQIVEKARFVGNHADDRGGGLAHQATTDSLTLIIDSKFKNNTADLGGAICDVSGEGTVVTFDIVDQGGNTGFADSSGQQDFFCFP